MSPIRLFALVAVLVAACDFFRRDKKSEGEEPERERPTIPLGDPRCGKDHFVFIPGDTFTLGPDDDSYGHITQPAHQVTLSSFCLLDHEVTNGEYRLFARATRRSPPEQLFVPALGFTWTPEQVERYTGERQPVVVVTWEEAKAYCQWLGGDLPTTAQWERAAQGEDGRHEYMTSPVTPIYIDEKGERWLIERTANVCSDAGTNIIWGGRKLCDMYGNVWEWIQDWCGDWPFQAVTDPLGPDRGYNRVFLGGPWNKGAQGTFSTFRRHRRNGYQPDIPEVVSRVVENRLA